MSEWIEQKGIIKKIVFPDGCVNIHEKIEHLNNIGYECRIEGGGFESEHGDIFFINYAFYEVSECEEPEPKEVSNFKWDGEDIRYDIKFHDGGDSLSGFISTGLKNLIGVKK